MRLLRALVWLTLAGLVVVAGVVQLLADRWWPATALVYAPRSIWALPLAVLVPAAALRQRRLLLPLAVAALVALFPIMGFQVPSPRVLFAGDAGRDLRVMTYNVGGAVIDPARLAPLLAEIGPDVAVFQECNTLLEGARPSLEARGWHVETQYGACIASRFPIRAVDARDPRDLWAQNGAGIIVRYEIEAPGMRFDVLDLHLATVRHGLGAMMRRAFWRGVPELEASIRQRDLESSLGRAWTERAKGPLVIGGDFNLPVESQIYQRHWSSFANAFSTAGLGLGRTKATRWHGIRIDHVLTGPGWQCVGAFVGPHLGGDHRPMVADLRLVR